MPALPTAILFDLDETILTFGSREALLTQVAQEFLDDLGSVPPDELGEAIELRFAEFWADSSRCGPWRERPHEARTMLVAEVFEKLRDRAPGLSTEYAHRFADRFRELREAQESRPYPGAVETIEELRYRGVKLALITNGTTNPQRNKVERFDLGRLFDHVQIEGEHGFGKPDEQAYLHAMQVLGVSPHETWMVGDNLVWEVEAPQKLGIFAIWHDPRGKGLPAGTRVVPDRIIRSVTELLL